MKYIKKYNKKIDWDFFDDEEINPKLSDEICYIVKFRYTDNYSYNLNNTDEVKFRLLLSFEKNVILLDIRYDKLYVNVGNPIYDIMEKMTQLKINKKEYDIVKNNDFYITNTKTTGNNNFRKWKFSELEQKFNINIPTK